MTRIPNQVLAEVVTSTRIGLDHARLAGCLIMLQAQFNSLMHDKKAEIAPDAWVEIAEEVLAYEEEYEGAWAGVAGLDLQPTSESWRDLEERLVLLEGALRLACEMSVTLVRRLGGDPRAAVPVNL